MTINEAIKAVMRLRGAPMTVREVHDAIVSAGLYTFNAENPVHIVQGQLRRHCRGLDFASASETKHFELKGDDKYYLLERPVKESVPARRASYDGSQRTLLKELKTVRQKYEAQVRAGILAHLRRLTPTNFEHFAKKLLETYGFVEMKVTPPSKDGGIDGSGKLKVGLAHLNVAFQCKRYTNSSVGRPEIDKFRGAIQGEFEQGIFFTTSTFGSGAEAASFRRGAVPIILIDGKAIVDFMIEKRFGVQVELMPIFSYALDMALTDEENIISK
jgi:restriction system protein